MVTNADNRTSAVAMRLLDKYALRWPAVLALGLAVATTMTGCGPEDGRDDLPHVGPLDQEFFAVSDFFTPSGQMGDGAKPDFLTATSGKSCKDRPAGAHGRCYNFLYHPGNILWAGVYWAYPSNNWGSEAGRKFKPWKFEIDQTTNAATLTQRYNKVTFSAAADRDTFQIKLSGTDSTGKSYILRGAVFHVDGPTKEDIAGDLYLRSPATLTSPLTVSDPNAILTVKPGTYTISLDPGWTLVAPNTMGQLEEVVGATVAASSTTFTIAPGVDAKSGFDFTVGTETVHLALENPTVAFNFFAGDINDAVLRNITCPDPNKTCEHRDLISTAKPVLQLSRNMQSFSFGLLMGPPCVSAVTANGTIENSKFANSKTGIVTCATGTLRADGTVANCPPGKPGILNADQTITCCETPLASGVCLSESSMGSWVNANDIVQTVIGGFGWATNYAEFEAQNAILAGIDVPSAAAGAPSMGTPLVKDPSVLPSTTVYLDDIVWKFVAEEPAAAP